LGKKRIWFRPKEKLDFTCYRYRWHLFLVERDGREVILASASKLKYIKEYILTELRNWNCFTIDVRLRLYALCKKKGTGEIFKVPYDIFCEEED